MSTVFRTVAKCLCLDLNLFLFCRVSDIVQKVTYQKRLERRYDVVYWNTTFKLKTLEKNENFWLSPQEEKLEENFPMTQKCILGQYWKENWSYVNPSNWLFILDDEDGVQDIQLWEATLRTYYYNEKRSHIMLYFYIRRILYFLLHCVCSFLFNFSWLHYGSYLP